MEACFDLADEHETKLLGYALGSCLVAPLTLGFQGGLGVGKTTLIRAMLQAQGVTGSIKSPTFSLVESYDFSDYVIHHFDLYRLSDETALDALGFRDYFSPDAICCIEWPDRAPSLKAHVDVIFSLEVSGAGRKLSVTALRAVGEALLDNLQETLA